VLASLFLVFTFYDTTETYQKASEAVFLLSKQPVISQPRLCGNLAKKKNNKSLPFVIPVTIQYCSYIEQFCIIPLGFRLIYFQ